MSTTTTTTTTQKQKKPQNKKQKQAASLEKRIQELENKQKPPKQRKNKKKTGIPRFVGMDPLVVKAAIAWINHMSDPFNVPPVSIGGSGTPNYIWGAYGFKNTFSIPANTTDFAVGFQPGCLAANTGLAPAGYTTSTGNTTAWAALTAMYYGNVQAATAVVGVARPISASIRVSFKFTASVTPPTMYAGQIATSSAPSTSSLRTNPEGLFLSPTNHKGGPLTTSFQASWVPQDFLDLNSFLSGWQGAFPTNTTMPYIAATGLGGQTYTITAEYISFYEFQPSTQAGELYYLPAVQVPYTVGALWEAYMRVRKHYPPVLVKENPRTVGHKHGGKYGFHITGEMKQVNPEPELVDYSAGNMINGPSSSYRISEATSKGVMGFVSAAAALLSAYNREAHPDPLFAAPAALACEGCGTTIDKPGVCSHCKLLLEQALKVEETAGIDSVHTTPEEVTRRLDVMKRELMGVAPPARDLTTMPMLRSKPVVNS